MTQQKPEIEDLVYETKYKSKEFLRQAAKFDKEESKYKLKTKEQLKQNDMDAAKLYANQACGFYAKAIQFRRLAAYMDVAANQLKTAEMFGGFEKDIGGVIDSLKTMDVDPANIQMKMYMFNQLTTNLGVSIDCMNFEPDVVVSDKANNLIAQLSSEMALGASLQTRPEIVEGASGTMDMLEKKVNAI